MGWPTIKFDLYLKFSDGDCETGFTLVGEKCLRLYDGVLNYDESFNSCSNNEQPAEMGSFETIDDYFMFIVSG